MACYTSELPARIYPGYSEGECAAVGGVFEAAVDLQTLFAQPEVDELAEAFLYGLTVPLTLYLAAIGVAAILRLLRET